MNFKARFHRNPIHSESLCLTSRQIPVRTFLQLHFPSASLVVIFLNGCTYFSSFRMRVFMHECVLSHSIFCFINKYLWNTLILLLLLSYSVVFSSSWPQGLVFTISQSLIKLMLAWLVRNKFLDRSGINKRSTFLKSFVDSHDFQVFLAKSSNSFISQKHRLRCQW